LCSSKAAAAPGIDDWGPSGQGFLKKFSELHNQDRGPTARSWADQAPAKIEFGVFYS